MEDRMSDVKKLSIAFEMLPEMVGDPILEDVAIKKALKLMAQRLLEGGYIKIDKGTTDGTHYIGLSLLVKKFHEVK
jgi:hypothetical protein